VPLRQRFLHNPDTIALGRKLGRKSAVEEVGIEQADVFRKFSASLKSFSIAGQIVSVVLQPSRVHRFPRSSVFATFAQQPEQSQDQQRFAAASLWSSDGDLPSHFSSVPVKMVRS